MTRTKSEQFSLPTFDQEGSRTNRTLDSFPGERRLVEPLDDRVRDGVADGRATRPLATFPSTDERRTGATDQMDIELPGQGIEPEFSMAGSRSAQIWRAPAL
jgi:hypothetical protein